MTICPSCDHLPAVYCAFCLERMCPNCQDSHHRDCAKTYTQTFVERILAPTIEVDD